MKNMICILKPNKLSQPNSNIISCHHYQNQRKANISLKLKGICKFRLSQISTLLPSPSRCVFPYKAATSPATIPTMPPIPATKVGAAPAALTVDELAVEAALALELFELPEVDALLLLLAPLLVFVS